MVEDMQELALKARYEYIKEKDTAKYQVGVIQILIAKSCP